LTHSEVKKNTKKTGMLITPVVKVVKEKELKLKSPQQPRHTKECLVINKNNKII